MLISGTSAKKWHFRFFFFSNQLTVNEKDQCRKEMLRYKSKSSLALQKVGKMVRPEQGRILHRCGVCGARPVKLHSQKIIYLKLLLHRFNVRNISASATQSNAFFFHETTGV